jgi:hypothetical protein
MISVCSSLVSYKDLWQSQLQYDYNCNAPTREMDRDSGLAF